MTRDGVQAIIIPKKKAPSTLMTIVAPLKITKHSTEQKQKSSQAHARSRKITVTRAVGFATRGLYYCPKCAHAQNPRT